jgi:hypothetical protein
MGVAWEPSNKMMLFLPPRKIKSLTSPFDFLFESTLHLSFPYLSLDFKRENRQKAFSLRVKLCESSSSCELFSLILPKDGVTSLLLNWKLFSCSLGYKQRRRTRLFFAAARAQINGQPATYGCRQGTPRTASTLLKEIRRPR